YDTTRLSQSEQVVKANGPATTEGQIARMISLDALRPSRIRVFFEREVETRWDTEEEGGTTSYVEAKAGDDKGKIPEMRMRNVLSSPDVPALVIDGGTYAVGSYIPVRKAVEKWSEDLSAVPGPPALTLEKVRAWWFSLDSIYVPFGDRSATAAQAN